MLNVKDFGAVGDGKTDDTEAIQAAVDAAENGPASVYFPPGVYRIEFPIEPNYTGWRIVTTTEEPG